MFAYAFPKIFDIQFNTPNGTTLMGEVGHLAPIDVMRVFMGASRPYSALGGYLEVIAGVLLCFRRTTLLGAFVVLGVRRL